jgi:hypothetical protein
MKKVIFSKPLKGITTLGNYLVVEFDSGVVSIEKPRHMGLYVTSSVLDSRDIIGNIGAMFFMLVIGAFIDYFNLLPLSVWYMFMIFIIGVVLLAQLIFPRKVLVIETSNEIYYFTRPYGIDEKMIKEIVAKTSSVLIDREAQRTSENERADSASRVS